MKKQLSPNWVTEGLMDFEFKKYVLLDYLQYISKDFNEQRIYPGLSELIEHYRNLTELKQSSELLSNQFPKELTKVDFEHFRLEFESKLKDESFMQEMQQIIEYAIPLIYRSLEDGKELYQLVEEHINITPIGIIPIHTEFGYLFISEQFNKEFKVYEYQITLIEQSNEKYRGIKTSLIDTYNRSITNTFENVKINLSREIKSMPNPATFLIETDMRVPLNESLLPVAKRSFVRYLYQNNLFSS
jgi:hypothetical protein